jgi:hypothetical protein
MKINNKELKLLIKESIEEDDAYVEEVSNSFDTMSINDIARGMKSKNLTYDIPVKFLSGGHHIAVKSVKYIEAEGSEPYILLDM